MKKYADPQIVIIRFSSENIVTASTTSTALELAISDLNAQGAPTGGALGAVVGNYWSQMTATP